MIITKMHLSRRTVLRGMGAAIALPLLDGMVPAFAALRQTAAKPVRRLAAIYVPNGMNMHQWTPAEVGKGFELTPILQPLAAFRDQMLVVGGLTSKQAFSLPDEGAGDHSRAQATFLTGVRPKKTEGADIQAGISMDQIAARELGQHTQLGSLELALESVDLAGSCDIGYSCAYSGTISWRSATTPLPMEIDPRAVFERLFGATGSTDPRVRRARIQEQRSILDSVRQEAATLGTGLGSRDRAKLTEYLEAIRDIERRIQKAEEQSALELPVVDQPAGIPSTFEEHAKIMFDLLALAFQSDLTRVSTFMIGREISTRTYPEVGVPEPHHPVSHHQNDPAQLAKLAKINIFHMKMFARFLAKLRSTPDGDGSLLDHSIVLYGAGLSDSDLHRHDNHPILVVGGGAGQIGGGRHLRFSDDTPLANLHLTLLDKMGIPADQIGDSTGRIDLGSMEPLAEI